MPITFKNAQFHDGRPAYTLERAMRHACAYAGIHEFDFQDLVSEDFADLTSWTTDASATWSVAGGQLSTTGGGSTLWYQARHATEATPSFVASFDLVSGQGAFVVKGCSTDGRAFALFWTTSTCGAVYIDAARVGTNLLVLPLGVVAPARIEVAVKYILDSSDGDRKWLAMSLFVDGYCRVAETVEVSGYTYTGEEVGFAVYGSNSMVVDNLSISNAKRITEYASIDPGETVAAGLMRAIGTTRIAYACRYDGTLRIWRPANQDLDWTVPTDRVTAFVDRSERTKTLTHVRSYGVMHDVDRFEDNEGNVHMHRFDVKDDPNLWTEEEVYEEAGYALHEAKELQGVVQISMPPQVVLEGHDRISYDSVDYRVVSVDMGITMGRKGPRIASTVNARRYIAQ